MGTEESWWLFFGLMSSRTLGHQALKEVLGTPGVVVALGGRQWCGCISCEVDFDRSQHRSVEEVEHYGTSLSAEKIMAAVNQGADIQRKGEGIYVSHSDPSRRPSPVRNERSELVLRIGLHGNPNCLLS